MKVRIGPYRQWVGPYQIADFIFFWVPDYEEEESFSGKMRDRLANFLTHGFGQTPKEYREENQTLGTNSFNLLLTSNEKAHYTWFYHLLDWIHSKRSRNVKIKIDDFDTWNVEHTLALIALPLLKEFKKRNQGSPMVDVEDMPPHLQYTSHGEWGSQPQLEFEFYEETEEQHSSLVHDRFEWVLDQMIWSFEQILCEDSEYGLIEDQYIVDGKYDWDAINAHHKRVDEGLRLFGKYYRGLWS